MNTVGLPGIINTERKTKKEGREGGSKQAKGVPPKKGASETFGTDVIFCLAHCGVIIQRRSVLKISSYRHIPRSNMTNLLLITIHQARIQDSEGGGGSYRNLG